MDKETCTNNRIYLAGVFDGEGYVGIRRKGKGKPVHRNHSSYSLEASITTTSVLLIDFLGQHFPTLFKVYPRRWHPVPSYKKIYDAKTYGSGVVTLMKMLLPYLVIKKHKAEIALEFDEKYTQSRCGKSSNPAREALGEYYHQAMQSART